MGDEGETEKRRRKGDINLHAFTIHLKSLVICIHHVT